MKLRKCLYENYYTKAPESKIIKLDKVKDAEHIQGQVEKVLVENVREVCGYVRVERKPKKSGYNDVL